MVLLTFATIIPCVEVHIHRSDSKLTLLYSVLDGRKNMKIGPQGSARDVKALPTAPQDAKQKIGKGSTRTNVSMSVSTVPVSKNLKRAQPHRPH